MGPSANLNRFQFTKIMEDAGLVTPESGFKAASVNLVFQTELVASEKNLRYEHFYDALAKVGVEKFKNDHKILGARSRYHVKGCGLYVVLLDYMLPLAGKVAAVAYSQKTRNAS